MQEKLPISQQSSIQKTYDISEKLKKSSYFETSRIDGERGKYSNWTLIHIWKKQDKLKT